MFRPDRHIVAKGLNPPSFAGRDKRKNRVLHNSHRNGRTSTIVRMVDSRSPLRLDRWILWLLQFGQLLVTGTSSSTVNFSLIVRGPPGFCLSRLTQVSRVASGQIPTNSLEAGVFCDERALFPPVSRREGNHIRDAVRSELGLSRSRQFLNRILT